MQFKKLTDIKVKKVFEFFITINIKVKAKNKTLAPKVYCKFKLAVLIFKIYSEQIYNYY